MLLPLTYTSAIPLKDVFDQVFLLVTCMTFKFVFIQQVFHSEDILMLPVISAGKTSSVCEWSGCREFLVGYLFMGSY